MRRNTRFSINKSPDEKHFCYLVCYMTFHLKIQLKNITQPPVWRRLLVPARFNFWEFHLVIQAAFGWENYHMFQFSPSGYGSYPAISMVVEDFDIDDVTQADETKLGEIFKRESKLSPISMILAMTGCIK